MLDIDEAVVFPAEYQPHPVVVVVYQIKVVFAVGDYRSSLSAFPSLVYGKLMPYSSIARSYIVLYLPVSLTNSICFLCYVNKQNGEDINPHSAVF